MTAGPGRRGVRHQRIARLLRYGVCRRLGCVHPLEPDNQGSFARSGRPVSPPSSGRGTALARSGLISEDAARASEYRRSTAGKGVLAQRPLLIRRAVIAPCLPPLWQDRARATAAVRGFRRRHRPVRRARRLDAPSRRERRRDPGGGAGSARARRRRHPPASARAARAFGRGLAASAVEALLERFESLSDSPGRPAMTSGELALRGLRGADGRARRGASHLAAHRAHTLGPVDVRGAAARAVSRLRARRRFGLRRRRHPDAESGRSRGWRSPRAEFIVDGTTPFDAFPPAHALPIFEWGLNWVFAQRTNTHLCCMRPWWSATAAPCCFPRILASARARWRPRWDAAAGACCRTSSASSRKAAHRGAVRARRPRSRTRPSTSCVPSRRRRRSAPNSGRHARERSLTCGRQPPCGQARRRKREHRTWSPFRSSRRDLR